MTQTDGPKRFRPRHGVFAVFVIIVAAAVTWPGYASLGNRVEPFVLGLPMSLAWNVLWVVVTCLGLAVYHLARGARP